MNSYKKGKKKGKFHKTTSLPILKFGIKNNSKYGSRIKLSAKIVAI